MPCQDGLGSALVCACSRTCVHNCAFACKRSCASVLCAPQPGGRGGSEAEPNAVTPLDDAMHGRIREGQGSVGKGGLLPPPPSNIHIPANTHNDKHARTAQQPPIMPFVGSRPLSHSLCHSRYRGLAMLIAVMVLYRLCRHPHRRCTVVALSHVRHGWHDKRLLLR